MNDSFKNRVGSLRLVVGLTGLALSIFLWGLAYKLSLYESMQTSFHRIPHAKLLSENERPTAVAASNNLIPSGLLDFSLLPALAGGVLLGGFLVALRAEQERHRALSFSGSYRQHPLGAYFGSILFRPPPFMC